MNKTEWQASDWWDAFKASRRNPTALHLSDFVRQNVSWIAPRAIPLENASACHIRVYEPTEDPLRFGEQRLSIFVGLDYIGLGQQYSYLRTPITPQLGQELADRFGCILPTPKIVDLILGDANRLPAHMQDRRLWNVWMANAMNENDMAADNLTAEVLVAGHRKDVVLSDKLPRPTAKVDKVRTRNVAIYGWHGARGPNPLQPLYVRHSATYVDYSHGVRLISRRCLVHPTIRSPGVKTEERDILDVMSDGELGPLLCGKDYPLAFRSYPMLRKEPPLDP